MRWIASTEEIEQLIHKENPKEKNHTHNESYFVWSAIYDCTNERFETIEQHFNMIFFSQSIYMCIDEAHIWEFSNRYSNTDWILAENNWVEQRAVWDQSLCFVWP